MIPVVRTEALSKRYSTGGRPVDALDSLTLEVAEGEFVAVMGPSGSGKSTLMHLLGLLDRPSSGRYWFDGEDVGLLDADRQAAVRNRKFGFVFQNFNLLGRNTALENVELPLIYRGTGSAERRRRAAEVLGLVGLDHRSSHWPRQLSGGEQQRVAIARALVNNPRLILADEPTGALDSGTGIDILALFQELNRSGCTIVLVTHDIDIASHAGRLLKLHDGRMVSDMPVTRPHRAASRRAMAEQKALPEPA